MALTGCQRCMKYLLVVFNVVFGLLGVLVLALGVLALVILGQASMDDLKNTAGINLAIFCFVCIGVGVAIILAMCFFGCCGALKENSILLALYFVFLFLIFAIFLGIGIYAIVAAESLEDNIEEGLSSVIEKACDDDENAKSVMKSLQTGFECCGAKGASDYITCPAVGIATGCEVSSLLKPGCASALSDKFLFALTIPAYVFLGIAGFVVLGMILSVLLACAIKRNSCD